MLSETENNPVRYTYRVVWDVSVFPFIPKSVLNMAA